MMYDLDFDAHIDESDEVFEDKGVKILVDKKKFALSSRNYSRLFRWP